MPDACGKRHYDRERTGICLEAISKLNFRGESSFEIAFRRKFKIDSALYPVDKIVIVRHDNINA